jgi:hypothetical protein
MAFRVDEIMCHGGFLVGVELPNTCLIRLENCLGHLGDEMKVVVPADTAKQLSQIPPGQFVWVHSLGNQPVDVALGGTGLTIQLP